jgi:hypothetical protein
MRQYTLEEAREVLLLFGIKIYVRTNFEGEAYAYRFENHKGEGLYKPDGYDMQSLKACDFNMVIDGIEEKYR